MKIKVSEVMHEKIGVIGHFGSDKEYYDGQTIKTKSLVRLLETCDGVSIKIVDTYFFKTGKMKLLLDTISCLFSCNHIFLLVSENGMKFYLPFLYFCNLFARKNIYHYIIGSSLLELVSSNKKYVKYLNAMTVNWFEYEAGTMYLQRQGVRNAETLANFKMIIPVKETQKYVDINGGYKFCTFSRVMEEKGITDAIQAICEINKENKSIVATLDIYGPLDAKYQAEFERLLKNSQHCVAYKGVVESNNSVEVIKNYYALLFPTRWKGEGVPGTVIDAFAAGIPVIASDWNVNKEIVQNGKQGIIYPNESLTDLKSAIWWSIQNIQKMDEMRVFSREEYINYMPDTILQIILEKMKKVENNVGYKNRKDAT